VLSAISCVLPGRCVTCGRRTGGGSAGRQPQRGRARVQGHHRVDVRAAVARVLGAVRLVDRGVVGLDGFHEGDVALDAAGGTGVPRRWAKRRGARGLCPIRRRRCTTLASRHRPARRTLCGGPLDHFRSIAGRGNRVDLGDQRAASAPVGRWLKPRRCAGCCPGPVLRSGILVWVDICPSCGAALTGRTLVRSTPGDRATRCGGTELRRCSSCRRVASRRNVRVEGWTDAGLEPSYLDT
jgi:hypothetical protein